MNSKRCPKKKSAKTRNFLYSLIGKTDLNFSWNYKFWGTAILKSTLVSSVCVNCTSRKLFAIYPKDSKSLMIWKKFQIFGLSIFPDFFCCFYWISRASAYLQAMKVRFTCQNVIFVHISNFSKTEVSATKKVLFFIRTKVFTYNNYYLSIIKVAHNCHTINLYSLRVCITFYGS